MGKRKPLTYLLIFIIFYSCTSSKITTTPFTDFFTKTKKILIPEDTGLSDFIYSAKYITPDQVILTEMFSRSMYLLNFTHESIEKLLTNGPGPGEYTQAYDFHFNQDTLFFNDKSDARFQFVSLLNMKASRLFPTANPTHCSFTKHHNELFFLNWARGYTHYLHDFHGEGFFKIPELFQTSPSPGLPLKILTLNNKLYFVNRFESKIFEFDLITKTENIIRIKNLPLENWDGELNNQMPKSTFTAKQNKKPIMVFFDIIYFNNTPHFIIGFPPHRMHPYRLYIITTDGRITHKITTQKYFPLASRGNKISTYCNEDNKYYIKEFTIRQNSKQLTLVP